MNLADACRLPSKQISICHGITESTKNVLREGRFSLEVGGEGWVGDCRCELEDF